MRRMIHGAGAGRRQVLSLLESDSQASIVEGGTLLDTRECSLSVLSNGVREWNASGT